MLVALTQRNREDDETPLLTLYWNRAGVKRELVSLKREHYQLLEKLEQQEGAIMQAQSQLEGLERLLTNPHAAANAMVYFQLRHMWRVAALKLEQFARELRSQREGRERIQLHGAVLAKRNRRLDAIKIKLDDLTEKRKRITDECRACEERLEKMNIVMRLFAGPGLKSKIQSAVRNREALDVRIGEFNDVIAKIKGEPLPEPEGLSLESRRQINLAVLALAQHLVVHFSMHELARLAKKASKCNVGDLKFGERRICDQLVERIRERIDDLNGEKSLADHVKQRVVALNSKVHFRNDSDSMPVREDLNEIVVRNDGKSPPLRINVLTDNYWDLEEVLI
jgi:hypothetical protein